MTPRQFRNGAPTPPARRIRHAFQARAARGGILLARRHMANPHTIQLDVDHLSGFDIAAQLFTRAYLREKLRIGARRRAQLALAEADPLAELYRWLDHRLAAENVPAARRPDRTRGLKRYGGCSIEYYDHAGARRVFFFVTTPDYDFVDRFLPRYQHGAWADDGWLPAVDHDPR